MNSVGRVLGTKDKKAAALEFWVGVEDGSYLQLDDVVYVETAIPGSSESTVRFYGTVQFVSRVFEGVEFDTDTHRVAEGIMPVNISYAANVSVTRVLPEIFIPPKPGDRVYRAEKKELETGLFIDRMKKKFPAGILRTGDPYFLNFDFINGENGAHISISGVSGIATKTTYATFLLYSILNSGVLEGEATNTKAIIFNVKGEDLLFLDKKNSKLPPGEEIKYSGLGLPAKSFDSVTFYAPPRIASEDIIAVTERRTLGIVPYMWTLRQIGKERLFSFLFSEGGEDLSNIIQAVRIIENKLYSLATSDNKPDEDPITSPIGKHLTSLFELHDDIAKTEPPVWFGDFQIHQGTKDAFLRRLHGAALQTIGLIRKAPPGARINKYKIDWQGGQVTVVDIHTLPSGAKMFVVGAILKKIFKEKEERGTSRPIVFVVVDELNKYAPREGWSPIKDILLDISERGRSLGVILIGAQQTASEVELRVYANSAIKVVGRMDSAEVDHREYGFLGNIFKQRARIVTPGTMIVQQPDVPTPMLLTFPFPAWATRPDEIDRKKEDNPFDF